MSPHACSDLPRNSCGPHSSPTRMFLYLVLLRMGFTMPSAFANAVRSYRTFSPLPTNYLAGGIFSVALSVSSRPPGVTWHPVLRSPDFPPPSPLCDASDHPVDLLVVILRFIYFFFKIISSLLILKLGYKSNFYAIQ